MIYRNLNDYDLLERIKVADSFAMDILIKKYEPVIVGISKKFYSKAKYQGSDMNDLVQEGRIAVLRAINAYDYEKDSLFYTYVSVCIKNHLISYCRNLDSRKHSFLNYSLAEEFVFNVSDVSFEPMRYLNEKNFDSLISLERYELSFIDGCVFELRYNGFSYKEISNLLDMSMSSVSRRLCKIKKSLQLLKDKI